MAATGPEITRSQFVPGHFHRDIYNTPGTRRAFLHMNISWAKTAMMLLKTPFPARIHECVFAHKLLIACKTPNAQILPKAAHMIRAEWQPSHAGIKPEAPISTWHAMHVRIMDM